MSPDRIVLVVVLVAEVLYRPFNNVCHKADTDSGQGRHRVCVCMCVCVPDTVRLLLLLLLLLFQGQAILESIWPGHNSPEIIYICMSGRLKELQLLK